MRVLKEEQATELLFVGRVRRPDLFKAKFDFGVIRYLPAILGIFGSGGDDGVLRSVVRFFERRGLKVIGPAAVAPELLIGPGPFGAASPEPHDRSDIETGFRIVRALGAFDIGQSVVMAAGKVAAVEAAEGTDAMLARVARLRRAPASDRGAMGGVLVKRPKPGQELRVDLPAIGPQTINGVAEAGLSGICVLAGHVLAAGRKELVARADAKRLFVFGYEESGVPETSHIAACAWGPLAAVGKCQPVKKMEADAARGALVLAVLKPFGAGAAAVVDSRHVLSVEAGDGAEAAIARAGELRQWGKKGSRRRTGVAVVAADFETQPGIVRAAAQAGLAGVVVCARAEQRPLPAATIEEANRLGLVIARIVPVKEGAS